MKIRQALWAAALLAFLNIHAPAATLYVSPNSINPVPPYTNWSTAATNIQDAVDASTNGDLILVTNGVYQTGGRLSSDGASNRVVVANAVTIQSVNGQTVTLIDGGDSMRCIYLTNGATLAGFTLTNGNTANVGGGVYCSSTDALVSNCLLVNNTAYDGGGAYSGILTNCTLAFNSASAYGGGANSSTLNNCVVTNNIGSGTHNCTLNNCLLAGNTGYGASMSKPNNCTIVGNGDAGAVECTSLNNCIIYYNNLLVGSIWGDVYQSGMTNCCVGSSFAAYGSDNITNPPAFVDVAHSDYRLQIGSPCINAGTNFYAPTGPDLAGNPRIVGGTVDIGALESDYTNLPGLHFVSLNSTNPVPPYTNWLTAATNIQEAITVAQPGEMVIVGPGTYTNGGLAVYGQVTNRVAITKAITVLGLSDRLGTNLLAAAMIVGNKYPLIRCVYVGSNAVLSGFVITNGNVQTGGDMIHDLSGGGVWCETSGVVSNCLVISNSAPLGYGGGVYGGTAYHSTFINNVASRGGGAGSNMLINCSLEYNLGTFEAGGAIYSTLSNCLVVGNQAVGGGGNGGGGAAFSTLTGCVVSNNTAVDNGGGVYMGVATDSLISSNYASGSGGGGFSSLPGGLPAPAPFLILSNCTLRLNHAGSGGAMYQGTLDHCVVSDNSAVGGSAAHDTILNNCVITNNSNSSGDVLDFCTLSNCLVMQNASAVTGVLGHGTAINCTIVTNLGLLATASTFLNSILYYNADTNAINAAYISNCCVTALGAFTNNGNFTNPPLFVNLDNSDFQLQSNSPCINSGNNAYVISATDLGGNPRIVGGTVDIGAYEYQTPASVISYAWLQQYDLPTDGSVDYADLDGTGFNVYQDWIAGLNPTNFLSVLAMLPPVPTNSPSGLVVSWESVSDRTYFLQSSTNLAAHPAFSTLQSNIVGQPDTTSFMDTNAVGNGPFFYRVGVQQ